MIMAKRLNGGYAGIQVLYDVSFSANDNEVTAIVGPNGCGKSTLLKTLMGLTTFYSGSIEFGGINITSFPTHERVKLGIAYVPQTRNVYTSLTVKENLLMAGYMLSKDIADESIGSVADTFPFLSGCMSKRARALSGGQRQMLAMAMGLMRKPKAMIFDEPTSNLASGIADEVLGKIRQLREQFGLTIIIVEQDVQRILDMADRALLLVSGRASFEGKAQDLIAHKDFGRMFLGIEEPQ
jgi:branched-chain amino acid transport system ATP-binding protein